MWMYPCLRRTSAFPDIRKAGGLLLAPSYGVMPARPINVLIWQFRYPKDRTEPGMTRSAENAERS